MTEQQSVLDISWATIIKLAIAALVLYVLFLTKDIWVWVVFGIIISVLFDPAISFLQRFRIPRGIAAVCVYFLTLGLIGFMILATAPFFVAEGKRFIQLVPEYLITLSPYLQGVGVAAFNDIQSMIEVLIGGVETMATNVFNALFALFGGIFATIFIVSVAVFLSLDEKGIERAIRLLFPKKHEALALDVWEKSQSKVSGWFVSRIISCAFVGGATAVALLVFKVQYPFSLGLFSGVLNFIPYVGPLVAAVFIGIIVALEDLTRAMFVVIALVVIQMLENTIIIPLLSRKFVGISPVIVIIALAVGGSLWGAMGAILSIPLAGIIVSFFGDFLRKRKDREEVPVVL
ncbi:MAG: AI-2E family transporter [bacterium]|nr:AI-2E family transporter [bacterium]